MASLRSAIALSSLVCDAETSPLIGSFGPLPQPEIKSKPNRQVAENALFHDQSDLLCCSRARTVVGAVAKTSCILTYVKNIYKRVDAFVLIILGVIRTYGSIVRRWPAHKAPQRFGVICSHNHICGGVCLSREPQIEWVSLNLLEPRVIVGRPR